MGDQQGSEGSELRDPVIAPQGFLGRPPGLPRNDMGKQTPFCHSEAREPWSPKRSGVGAGRHLHLRWQRSCQVQVGIPGRDSGKGVFVETTMV